MAELHKRLLAAIARYEGAMGTRTLVAALRAVVEVHEPVREGGTLGYFTCRGCDNGSYAIDSPDWPCSTIQAIARELGVDG